MGIAGADREILFVREKHSWLPCQRAMTHSAINRESSRSVVRIFRCCIFLQVTRNALAWSSSIHSGCMTLTAADRLMDATGRELRLIMIETRLPIQRFVPVTLHAIRPESGLPMVDTDRIVKILLMTRNTK